TTSGLVDMASAALATTGGGQAHTNMQPFLTLNYIIALQGLFPSRG
ncbi:MAG: phage tail protein, partial [Pseudomonadota bacterium]